jgi:hypothetical protein
MILCWKFVGKGELCLVGKNFSFVSLLDIFVMMKSKDVSNDGALIEGHLCIEEREVELVFADYLTTYNPS